MNVSTVEPTYQAAKYDGSPESAAAIVKWTGAEGGFQWNSELMRLVKIDAVGFTVVEPGDYIIKKPMAGYEILAQDQFAEQFHTLDSGTTGEPSRVTSAQRGYASQSAQQ